MKFRSKYPYVPSQGEVNNEPSMTVPGETHTIKELMARATNGLALPQRSVEFFDEEDVDAINEFFAPGSLDLTDLDRLKRATNTLRYRVEKASKKQEEAVETGPEPVDESEPETPTE